MPGSNLPGSGRGGPTSAPKPDKSGLEPDAGGLKQEAIQDGWLRLIGIPGFGLTIPHLYGLFGPHGPERGIFWAGTLWFLLLSVLIWHGNRWLLFKGRARADWSERPVRKILLLLGGVLFGTIPITAAMLLAWYRLLQLPPSWQAIQAVTLTNVICVVFVTHVYETVFLIQAREDDRLRVERLSRARTEAELLALKAQVDPHFLFNCLNALGYLIGRDPERAGEFNRRLAEVYRYMLTSQQRPLVFLGEELSFVEDYLALLRLRFGDAIRLRRTGPGAPPERRLLPPVSIQVLLENAVKHNELSQERPLEVELRIEDRAVVLGHERRPRERLREAPREGSDGGGGPGGVGLRNLAERFRLATSREVEILDGEGRFTVRLPLLSA